MAPVDPLSDPGNSVARRRELLGERMRAGAVELAKTRAGRVEVAFDAGRAQIPVDARLRVDPEVVPERSFLLVAAVIGALATGGGKGLHGGGTTHLVLESPGADPEVAALAFAESAARIDRVRADAVLTPGLIDPVDQPVLNPELLAAERVAALGGDPTDPTSLEAYEETILAAQRPHDDPDPASRIARRILQRLNGMGKWGGYHTEFVHLPRGFAGNERALAIEVGEALLDAGLLAEKQSVGQRHVYLNPRRAGEIHRMIETGERPTGLTLPFK
jgi:hypothetical protein